MSHISNLINLTLHGKEDIDEHIMTLFSLAISVKPKKIIELGVRSARSSYAFLSACIFLETLSKPAPNPLYVEPTPVFGVASRPLPISLATSKILIFGFSGAYCDNL